MFKFIWYWSLNRYNVYLLIKNVTRVMHLNKKCNLCWKCNCSEQTKIKKTNLKFECMCKTNGIHISKQDVQLSSKGKRWDHCVLQSGYQASAWIRKQVSENTAKQYFNVMIYGCLALI